LQGTIVSISEVRSGSAAAEALVPGWGGASFVRVELSSVAEAFSSGLGNLDVSASANGTARDVAEVGTGGIGAKRRMIIFLIQKF